MADVTWPYAAFAPRHVACDLVTKSGSGGRTISGREQIVQSDAGYWEITLSECRIRSNADVLAWRELESLIQGRAHSVLVPAYSRIAAPQGSTVAVLGAGVALGAVTAEIDVSAGGPLEEGQDFSVGESLYRIREVISNSGDIWTVKFQPPARAAMAEGASVEFDRPVCRCRLKDETGMQADLDLLVVGTQTVVFCEDGT